MSLKEKHFLLITLRNFANYLPESQHNMTRERFLSGLLGNPGTSCHSNGNDVTLRKKYFC